MACEDEEMTEEEQLMAAGHALADICMTPDDRPGRPIKMLRMWTLGGIDKDPDMGREWRNRVTAYCQLEHPNVMVIHPPGLFGEFAKQNYRDSAMRYVQHRSGRIHPLMNCLLQMAACDLILFRANDFIGEGSYAELYLNEVLGIPMGIWTGVGGIPMVAAQSKNRVVTSDLIHVVMEKLLARNRSDQRLSRGVSPA